MVDEYGGSDQTEVVLHIVEVNEDPLLDPIAEITVSENELAAFAATAADSDLPPQALSFSLGGAIPTGAAIDPDTGEFTWTPGEADGPGDYTFQVIVNDGDGGSDSADVTIHVLEDNQDPVLDAIADLTVNELETAAFTATATDPDLPAQTLSFSLGGTVPAGAVIDSSSGAFTWTPGEADGPGAYTFQVVVADGLGGSDFQDVTITVREVSGDPMLDPIADLTVNELETAAFTATATDPDVPTQSLLFSLGGTVPNGAAINPNSGEFTWTPGEADGPGDFTFQVIVTDDDGLEDSVDVTIHVLEVNADPVLGSIDDLTINEHETATFTATATDGDVPAQTLTFSLGGNAPAGAAIDPDSGDFTWTTGEADGPRGLHVPGRGNRCTRRRRFPGSHDHRAGS